MIKHFKDILQGKAKFGEKRSPKWSRVRKIHIKENPKCLACGGTKKLEVHHIKPFNKNPELELDLDNIVTLCENKNNGVNCHLLFGHLGNYRSINPDIIKDAKIWFKKITNR